MPSLRALQRAFFRALESGAAGSTAPDAELLAVVRGSAGFDPSARLDVYAQMYWMRIADALREDYPRLAAIVGDHGFHALARAYLAGAPSRHPSLGHVGDGFADFLEGRAGVPPFAADLARLEWARGRVFTAADAPLLTLDELRALAPGDWGTLRLRTIPALALLELRWPAHEVWAADTGSPPACEARATSLRVWRDESHVYHAPLDVVERAALPALEAGTTFADVCALVGAVQGEAGAAEEAGALLLRWIADRLLLALR